MGVEMGVVEQSKSLTDSFYVYPQHLYVHSHVHHNRDNPYNKDCNGAPIA
jgi:hypothetical protein